MNSKNTSQQFCNNSNFFSNLNQKSNSQTNTNWIDLQLNNNDVYTCKQKEIYNNIINDSSPPSIYSAFKNFNNENVANSNNNNNNFNENQYMHNSNNSNNNFNMNQNHVFNNENSPNMNWIFNDSHNQNQYNFKNILPHKSNESNILQNNNCLLNNYKFMPIFDESNSNMFNLNNHQNFETNDFNNMFEFENPNSKNAEFINQPLELNNVNKLQSFNFDEYIDYNDNDNNNINNDNCVKNIKIRSQLPFYEQLNNKNNYKSNWLEQLNNMSNKSQCCNANINEEKQPNNDSEYVCFDKMQFQTLDSNINYNNVALSTKEYNNNPYCYIKGNCSPCNDSTKCIKNCAMYDSKCTTNTNCQCKQCNIDVDSKFNYMLDETNNVCK
jgi:hypothetical protein